MTIFLILHVALADICGTISDKIIDSSKNPVNATDSAVECDEACERAWEDGRNVTVRACKGAVTEMFRDHVKAAPVTECTSLIADTKKAYETCTMEVFEEKLRECGEVKKNVQFMVSLKFLKVLTAEAIQTAKDSLCAAIEIPDSTEKTCTLTKEGRRLEGEEDDVSGFRTDGIQTNDDGSVTDHKNDAVVLEVELVDEDEEEDDVEEVNGKTIDTPTNYILEVNATVGSKEVAVGSVKIGNLSSVEELEENQTPSVSDFNSEDSAECQKQAAKDALTAVTKRCLSQQLKTSVEKVFPGCVQPTVITPIHFILIGISIVFVLLLIAVGANSYIKFKRENALNLSASMAKLPHGPRGKRAALE